MLKEGNKVKKETGNEKLDRREKNKEKKKK